MEEKKARKSRLTIEFNNPDAVKILRTQALLQSGMTMRGKMMMIISRWLMEQCQKTPEDVERILGYKF